jgi:hypothetical protein
MIAIDITKAKAITHEKRRAARAAEFAPLDEVIAKQIPGTNAQAVEAERQAVRDKYAAIQTDIDSAPGVNELKLIVESLKEGA